MKLKKSKQVHHYRDGYTPVVRCHLSRRHKVAGTDKDAWCTGVSVAFPQKIDIEQMALDISNATTATPTDVKLVWDALRTAITDALCEGHRVQLDGLGSLTMELSSHSGPTPPTGKDVRISGIRFRPDKNLASRLADVKFRVEGVKRKPLTEAELEEALREYFTTHEDIHVRELARIGHFAVSTAYRKLNAYVEQGKLELVPRSSHYYRWVGE